MNEFSMTKTSPIVSTPKGKLRGFHYNGVDHFLASATPKPSVSNA